MERAAAYEIDRDKAFWYVLGGLALLRGVWSARAAWARWAVALASRCWGSSWPSPSRGAATRGGRLLRRHARLTGLTRPLALDPLGSLMMVVTALTGVGIGWNKPTPAPLAAALRRAAGQRHRGPGGAHLERPAGDGAGARVALSGPALLLAGADPQPDRADQPVHRHVQPAAHLPAGRALGALGAPEPEQGPFGVERFAVLCASRGAGPLSADRAPDPDPTAALPATGRWACRPAPCTA